MLFYITCPTCSRLLSRNLDQYSAELESIRSNPQLKNKEKEKQSAKLLDKYGYKKICCRIRIMGYIPYHEIYIT